MSGVISTIKNKKKLIARKKQKIVQSGRSSHLALGKELKNIVKIGDEFDMYYYVEKVNLVIHAVKIQVNCQLNDIRNFAIKNNFKIIDDKSIGDVNVFQAVQDSITINCTHDLNSYIVNVTIFDTTPVTSYDEYEKLKQHALALNSDSIIQPKGDLDVVNVLEDPSQYDLNFKKAFSLLVKAKKKIGLTAIFKFDNKNHDLFYIEKLLNDLF